MLGAFFRREASVIRTGADAIAAQFLRHTLRAFAREAIDDAAFLAPLAQKFYELIVRPVFGDDAISQVRAIEAGDIRFRLAQF